MAFRVEISPRAFNDLDDIAQYIKQRGSFEQAEKWFNGIIIAAIRTREDFPHRCQVAEESEELGQEAAPAVRKAQPPQYKVYYSVQQTKPSTGTIRVFHVSHWARITLSSDQLWKLMATPPAIPTLRRQKSS
jgi:plasmid stabilization system protein ParE